MKKMKMAAIVAAIGILIAGCGVRENDGHGLEPAGDSASRAYENGNDSTRIYIGTLHGKLNPGAYVANLYLITPGYEDEALYLGDITALDNLDNRVDLYDGDLVKITLLGEQRKLVSVELLQENPNREGGFLNGWREG